MIKNKTRITICGDLTSARTAMEECAQEYFDFKDFSLSRSLFTATYRVNNIRWMHYFVLPWQYERLFGIYCHLYSTVGPPSEEVDKLFEQVMILYHSTQAGADAQWTKSKKLVSSRAGIMSWSSLKKLVSRILK